MTTASMFLDDADLVRFTGWKTKKKQIEALRRMGVAFFINGTGHPIVAKSVVDGSKSALPEKDRWIPRVLRKN